MPKMQKIPNLVLFVGRDHQLVYFTMLSPTSCLNEHMKGRMLKVYMAITRNHFFFQKRGAFDYGMKGLCGGGA